MSESTRTTSVGLLTEQDIGSHIILSNGTETHEDTLVEVTHRKGTTRIETQVYWGGNWPSTTTCTIIKKGASL